MPTPTLEDIEEMLLTGNDVPIEILPDGTIVQHEPLPELEVPPTKGLQVGWSY